MTEIKKQSPQSMLSENLLVHALIKLLDNVPYKQINITILTKEADVARRTFYRHFKSIDELLDFTLQQIATQFYKFQMQQAPKDLKELIFVYFTYWESRKDFLIVLKQNDLLYRLQIAFISITQENQMMSQQSNNIVVDYAIAFSSGAVWSLLVKWLEYGAMQSPKEMKEIAEKVLNHILQNNTN